MSIQTTLSAAFKPTYIFTHITFVATFMCTIYTTFKPTKLCSN